MCTNTIPRCIIQQNNAQSKRIGLLTDELIPEYEKLGVMGYADGRLRN